MTTINYHPEYLSGCCEWLRRLREIDKSIRLYDNVDIFEIKAMPFFADFPFTWQPSAGIILFSYQVEWPIEMLWVNELPDYNSFISLN